MTLRMSKVWALLKKDIKDTLKNGNFLLIALLPLVFVVLYSMISLDGEHMDSGFVMTLGLLMTLTLVPISAMSMMIAEEKEKNTLRTLMLSNVSAMEFLLSKAIVVFALVEIVCCAIFAITHVVGTSLVRFLLVTGLSSINLLLFGALIGLLSPNQMSTGMASAPMMLLLLIPSVFAQVSEGFAKFAQFIPTYAMMQLISGTEGSVWMPVAVLVAWTALAAVLFSVVYRRKQMDT